MQKIVINVRYGGFGLSPKARIRYEELGGKATSDYRIGRNESALVQTVEELGEEASGRFAELKVVEIPDGVDWVVEEYDGSEWVSERHETWS